MTIPQNCHIKGKDQCVKSTDAEYTALGTLIFQGAKSKVLGMHVKEKGAQNAYTEVQKSKVYNRFRK